MTRKHLKHLILFFLSASVIVGAIDGSAVETGKPATYNEEDYENLADVGSGGYGAVSKVREKKTGKIYALKTFKTGSRGYEHARNEIKALKQLDHENIVKMVASTDITKRREYNSFHIVLEHMPQDLEGIWNHPRTKEKAREILHQILKGVAHIHSKNIIHRDIGTKNILVDPKTMAVKICDFGLCLEGKNGDFSFDKDPTGGYYCDLLSIADLIGHFYIGRGFSKWCVSEGKHIGNSVGDFERKIRKDFRASYDELESVLSPKGMDFFQKIFSPENSGRYAAEKALEHPFFTEGREHDPLPKVPKQRRWCC
ncbi:MAG: CMGC protein kinase [Amphiamblys sp. WSBS2006]|nr:MAG: CMGC protein kinase [Amphiamblys sp. WSBS2006]